MSNTRDVTNGHCHTHDALPLRATRVARDVDAEEQVLAFVVRVAQLVARAQRTLLKLIRDVILQNDVLQ